MAVKAEIMGNKAKLGTYNATDTESINALKAIVAKDLVRTGSGFEVENPVEGANGAKLIKIRYSNTALKANGIEEGTPAETGHVNYVITVTAGDATLEVNKTDAEYGEGGTTPVSGTVTVRFYKESELTTLLSTKTVNEGEAIGSGNMPADPTKEADATYSYTFNGWKKAGDNSAFSGTTTVSTDTNVYADWTATPVAVADPTATFGEANATYASSFGKKVSGYSPTAGSNWRLFYADSNYAYLISDSIGNKALNDSTLFSDFSSATMSDLGKNLNPKCSATFWTNNAGYNNVKGIAGLLNTSKWTNYKTNDAEWAIGAPTLEMFIASYNATHTTAMNTQDNNVIAQQLDSQVASDTEYGYQVKKGSEAYSNVTTGLGNTSDLDKAIYCPSSGHWWLASPSARSDYSVMFVSASGYLNFSDYDDTYGVRPLVCVPISKIGNGITITSTY